MENTRADDGMKYVGDGMCLVGVPARDLTAEEVLKFGAANLLASGLYALVKKAYTPKPRKSALKGTGENADKE